MKITGVAHVHSTYSYDGKLTLTELRDLFVSKGLSFCLMSEHTDKLTREEAIQFVQECKALTTSSFVFIPGFEVPYTSQKTREHAHVLMYGTAVFLSQYADADILKNWSEHAALTVLAHPVRNNFKLDEVMEEVIDGVEIWNQQYDGKLVPRTCAVKLLEVQKEKNKNLLATGGLDFHRSEHMGTPVLSLEVGTLTESEIIRTLQSGAFTFGSSTCSVSSSGLWKGKGSITGFLVSLFSTVTIASGKYVNVILVRLGIKLPKCIAKAIRKIF